MAEPEGRPGAAPVIAPLTASAIARLGLLAELDAKLNRRYPGEPTNGVEADGFEDGGGGFLLARQGGAPAGCGAFRPADPRTVEIKRRYVRAAHRGHGIAGRLLEALEAAARRRGFAEAILETGTRQPGAIERDRRHGDRPIPNFGDYVGLDFSVGFGKSLGGEATRPGADR